MRFDCTPMPKNAIPYTPASKANLAYEIFAMER